MNTQESAPTDPSSRPVRPRPSWALIGIFLIMFTVGLALSRDFILPVLLAMLLALIFRPLRQMLNRIGLPNGVAAFLITAAAMVALAIGISVLSAPADRWISDAPRIAADVERKIADLRHSVSAVTEAAERLDDITDGSDDTTTAQQSVEVESSSSNGLLTGFLTSAPLVVGQLFFTLTLLFFLLASGDLFYRRIVQVIPRFHDKRRAIQILSDIEQRLSTYLSTITLINAGLGVSVGIMAWAIGLPDPILIGVMGFLMNYVPYVGAIAGSIIVFVIGFLSFDTTGLAVLGGGLYFALTTLEGQFVTPALVGRSLKLNPTVVFLSVAFWAWLWSVVGMVIAVPILVVIRVFCEHIPAMQPLGQFLISTDETEISKSKEQSGEIAS